MKEQFEKFAASGVETAQRNYEKMFGATKEQVEKANLGAVKGYEEMQRFSKENFDACVAASTIFTKGFETMGKAWMGFTQQSLEASAVAAKSLLGAKTLREAVDAQTDFAKSSFDKFVGETTKLSEMSVKVANEAFEPITARLNVAVEKFMKPAA